MRMTDMMRRKHTRWAREVGAARGEGRQGRAEGAPREEEAGTERVNLFSNTIAIFLSSYGCPLGLQQRKTSQVCALKSSRSLSRTHASDRSHFFALRGLRPRRRAAGMTTHGVCTNLHLARCRTCGARILLVSLAQPDLREDEFECVVQFVRRNALGPMDAHGLRR